jgi:hypothetical protein
VKRGILTTALCGVMIGAAAPDVRAADKKPVPSVVLQAADGAPVELAMVATEGAWLVLYVAPGAPATGRLLEALRQWQLPSLDHVVVIAGGQTAEATAFVQADHQLQGVRFMLDRDREAWRALQLSGAPTVIGIRNNVIDWRLTGVLNDPESLRAVVTTWLTTP